MVKTVWDYNRKNSYATLRKQKLISHLLYCKFLLFNYINNYCHMSFTACVNLPDNDETINFNGSLNMKRDKSSRIFHSRVVLPTAIRLVYIIIFSINTLTGMNFSFNRFLPLSSTSSKKGKRASSMYKHSTILMERREWRRPRSP